MKLFYIILIILAIVGIAIAIGLIVPTKRTGSYCCKDCPECTCKQYGRFKWISRRNCPCPNCIYKKMFS